MIKSIFLKYIFAFLAILSISFVILAVIISANVVKYANETQHLSMVNAAKAAKQYIENNVLDDFTDEENLTNLSRELAAYVELAEYSFIFITDTDGKIILSTPLPANYLKKESVSENLIHEILAFQKTDRFQTLDGLFATGHLVFTQNLNDKNGEVHGVLFYCSSSTTASAFSGQIINTIILSCLWILVATIVIIYFMTEKAISPVRAMSRAARSFALGRFDVRVPVKGGDEIAELAAAFNNMAAALAANDEKQRMFIANVSHDLRTPMTTIAGFIDGILDGTISEDKRDYYLNIISDDIRRLARFVTDMFEFTRMQAGERKYNKTNFDICEKARLVLISLEQKIESKNIEIDFESEADKMQVYADSDAIHQVLQNLCENAIKFTPKRGLIKINIYSDEKEKKIRVSVFNTGEGIPPEDIPIIFDRFYKSDRSRGLDKSGMGLGLSITKSIIDAHEESIQVYSEYGTNCEFIFTLRKIYETSINKI
jgi:signal transduction histidine kinase